MSEFGYIPEAPEQSAFNNKGIFSPKDIYNLDRADKWTPQLGQLELIETQTASADSFIDFTSIQESTYNIHFMTINNIDVSSDGADISFRFYESGVLETASVYQSAFQQQWADGFVNDFKSTGANSLKATSATGSATKETAQAYHYFYNLGDSAKYSFQTGQYLQMYLTPTFFVGFGSGVLPQTSTVDGIRLFSSAGTFSGTVSLYGIKEYS
jgi:hypothetical protein